MEPAEPADENGDDYGHSEELVFPGYSNNNELVTKTLEPNEYLQRVIFYHNTNSNPSSLVGVLLRTSHQTEDREQDLIIAKNHERNVKDKNNSTGKEFCLDLNYKSYQAHYLKNPNKNSKGFAQPSSNNTISERNVSCERNNKWSPASIENKLENTRAHNLIRNSRNVDGFGAWVGAMRRYPEYWGDQSDGNNHRYSHRQNIYRN